MSNFQQRASSVTAVQSNGWKHSNGNQYGLDSRSILVNEKGNTLAVISKNEDAELVLEFFTNGQEGDKMYVLDGSGVAHLRAETALMSAGFRSKLPHISELFKL